MKRWWQREPAIAWGLVLFFPIGLLLMWKYAPWRTSVKLGWTAAFAALVVVVAVTGSSGGGKTPSSAAAQRTAGTPQATQSTTHPTTETTRAASAGLTSPLATATPDSESNTEQYVAGVTPVAATVPGSVALPDPNLTPGDVLPVGIAQICVVGYSSSVRSVTIATKDEVYAEYHIVSHAPGQYEVDHLIPLELGGSNSVKNLWPEPAQPEPGFHQKDLLENRLHELVCARSLDLATAQHAIAANWYAAFVRYVLGDDGR